MKKVILVGLAAVAVLGAVVYLGRDVQAEKAFGPHGWKKFGRFGRGLEAKAEIFGMSTDELKAALEDKSFIQIAQEKGISCDELREYKMEWFKKRWQEKGLSNEEIAEREQKMDQKRQERLEYCCGQ